MANLLVQILTKENNMEKLENGKRKASTGTLIVATILGGLIGTVLGLGALVLILR